MGDSEYYSSKKTYLKRLVILTIVFISLQILFTYLIAQTQTQLDYLNQLDSNCNLKQSIVTVIKKTVDNIDANHDFAECAIMDEDNNPFLTNDMFKSQQTTCKNNLLIYNSLNWVVSIINTIGLGLLSAIILIPSNEPIFTSS